MSNRKLVAHNSFSFESYCFTDHWFLVTCLRHAEKATGDLQSHPRTHRMIHPRGLFRPHNYFNDSSKLSILILVWTQFVKKFLTS
jgi:hypothetical protein